MSLFARIVGFVDVVVLAERDEWGKVGGDRLILSFDYSLSFGFGANLCTIDVLILKAVRELGVGGEDFGMLFWWCAQETALKDVLHIV